VLRLFPLFIALSGANYPADKPGLPLVRQLPHAQTACLDDKRSMAQHLTAAGLQHMMPPCWDDIETYIAELSQQQQQLSQPNQGLQQELQQPEQKLQQQQQQEQQQETDAVHQGQHLLLGVTASTAEGAASPSRHSVQNQGAATASRNSSSSSSSSALLPGGSVFVKHRRGVKGQAVHVARTLQQLLQLQQRLRGSSRDFIVQQEVPPLLLQGCKFVMRVHVLAVPQLAQQPQQLQQQQLQQQQQQQRDQQQQQQQQQQRQQQNRDDPVAAAAVRVYVHKDVIVLQHAKPFDPASVDSAVHISSKGKHHPPPVLLADSQLPTHLQDSIWKQLQQLAAKCIQAVCHLLLPLEVHPGVVLYHLFGFDCMVDAVGRVVLLEVNSYPAIASGTMCKVGVSVYTRLVGDLVRLLVLPVADGVAPQPGGFLEVTP
jgi:hypothetical protein